MFSGSDLLPCGSNSDTPDNKYYACFNKDVKTMPFVALLVKKFRLFVRNFRYLVKKEFMFMLKAGTHTYKLVSYPAIKTPAMSAVHVTQLDQSLAVES